METVSARVPTDLAERVEQFASEKGVSQSEAVRRLLTDGLDDDDLERRVARLERRLDRLEEPPVWWPTWWR